MDTSWFDQFYDEMAADKTLQRDEWWLNQSGLDRALESMLIQQCLREVATAALYILKLSYFERHNIRATRAMVERGRERCCE